MTPSKRQHPQSPSSPLTVKGAEESHLSIATPDKVNGDTIARWMQAMQELQQREKYATAWQTHMGNFGRACKDWLSYFSWIDELASIVNSDGTVYLYVIVSEDHDLTVEDRLNIADFGITLGAAFNICTEARIATTPPQEVYFLIQNADKRRACPAS